jgi:aspartate aminotransferase-like enzyme
VATLVQVRGALSAAPLLNAAAGVQQAGAEGGAGGGLILGPAPGALAGRALRLSHAGPGASLAAVLESLACLGQALRSLGHDADLGAALATAAGTWSGAESGTGAETGAEPGAG